eukprot:c12148_g3_i2.p1 GENE.c12148_g3_i2~~c12148_g3_i2.p1  ORF type:complete len:612 (+),score=113.12 c12148_g3_i2:604-2439(+)
MHCAECCVNAMVWLYTRKIQTILSCGLGRTRQGRLEASGTSRIDFVSTVCACLFACLPVHSEAVSSIVCRAELGMTLWFVSGLFCHANALTTSASIYSRVAWSVLCGLCGVASLLSKEQGITFFAVILATEYISFRFNDTTLAQTPTETRIAAQSNNRHSSSKALVSSTRQAKSGTFASNTFVRLSLIAVWVFPAVSVRFWALRGSLPLFMRFQNPAAKEQGFVRLYTSIYYACRSVLVIFQANGFSCDYSGTVIPLITSLTDPRNILSLCVLATLLVWFVCTLGVGIFRIASFTAQRAILALSLCLLVIPFLPASNILFPVGYTIAERTLYLPSLGICLAISLLVCSSSFYSRSLSNTRYLFCLLIFLVAIASYFVECSRSRAGEWVTTVSLFESSLKHFPDHAVMHKALGAALVANPEAVDHVIVEKALRHYQEASRLFKEHGFEDDVELEYNSGVLYTDLTMPPQLDLGITCFHRALHAHSHLEALNRKFPQSFPPPPALLLSNILYNLATSQLRKSRPSRQKVNEAIDLLQKAVNNTQTVARGTVIWEQSAKFDVADMLNNMGAAYQMIRMWEKAERACRDALEIVPEHRLAEDCVWNVQRSRGEHS